MIPVQRYTRALPTTFLFVPPPLCVHLFFHFSARARARSLFSFLPSRCFLCARSRCAPASTPTIGHDSVNRTERIRGVLYRTKRESSRLDSFPTPRRSRPLGTSREDFRFLAVVANRDKGGVRRPIVEGTVGSSVSREDRGGGRVGHPSVSRRWKEEEDGRRRAERGESSGGRRI